MPARTNPSLLLCADLTPSEGTDVDGILVLDVVGRAETVDWYGGSVVDVGTVDRVV